MDFTKFIGFSISMKLCELSNPVEVSFFRADTELSQTCDLSNVLNEP